MRDANSPGVGEPGETTADDSPSSFGVDASTEPGSVHVITGSERVRIVLTGEVDADLAPELQEATVAAERSALPIEVDAHHVTFMDSSGVAFLARLASRSPYRVRLLRVPPTVQFLLDVTRIGELLDVVDGEVGFDPTLPSGGGDAA